MEKKSREKAIEKRFYRILFIAVVLLLLSWTTTIWDVNILIKYTFCWGIGFIFWLFINYEILQNNKYYWYCFAISVAFICHGLLIKLIFSNREIEYIELFIINPAAFLIIQKPLRYIFIKIFKREPDPLSAGSKSLADFFYTFLLMMSNVILAAMLIKFER